MWWDWGSNQRPLDLQRASLLTALEEEAEEESHIL